MLTSFILKWGFKVSLPQQKFREIVFQLLYSKDMGKADEEDMIPLLMKQLSVTRKSVRQAQEYVNKILGHLKALDKMLAKASFSYAFERIQSVERNILRLGLFELVYDPAVPPKVAITESLRLAKKFGTPESAAFVNAILDNIYKDTQGIKIDQNQISTTSEALIQSESRAEEVARVKPIEDQDEDEDDN